MKWICVVFLYISSPWSTTAEPAPVVQTKSGLVQGEEYTLSDNRTVLSFSGIPYAQPPLRFSPPVPVQPWSGVLQAIGKHKPCIQQFILGLAYHRETLNTTSEDCLKLNLVVPNPAPVNAPVLIYIHGGSFSVGSVPDASNMASLASDENIVVASMNYRLNVFSFVSLGIPEAPGNLALMDQHLAMKWVKENIEAFGGNPDKITIAGMSSGSACVNYHLMSNKEPELFQGAIMMSGTAGGRMFSEPEHSLAKTKKLVSLVGCDSVNTTAVLECLRRISATDLLKSEPGTRSFYSDFYKPSVDGIYVTEHPEVSLLTGNFNPVPVLTGVVSNEGSRFAHGLNSELFQEENGALSSDNVRIAMQRLLGSLANPVTVEALLLFYSNFTAQGNQLENRDSVLRAYGDNLFICGTNNFCDGYTMTRGIVYKYVYDHNPYGSWMGPDHSSDLPVVLGFHLTRAALDEKEEAFSRRLMRQWATFVRTGNPNVAGDGSPEWPRFNLAHRPHMIIDYHSRVGNHFRVRECSFWNKLLPSLTTFKKCKNL